MLTTMLYPEMVTKLVVWNIVGGVYGTFVLGGHYIVPSILAVRGMGIKGSAARRRVEGAHRGEPGEPRPVLALDRRRVPQGHVALAQRVRVEARPDDSRCARRDVRRHHGADADHPRRRERLDHPKRTSLEVSCLIKGSKLIDPPWPEDAWERAGEKFAASGGTRFNMFDTWVQAAPAILEFLGDVMHSLTPVRMCTSQFSEASSAVCTRLSGTRSRSALRSVT